MGTRARTTTPRILLLAAAVGVTFGVASVGAWAVAGNFQAAPDLSSSDRSSSLIDIPRGEIDGSEVVADYPDHARSEFDAVGMTLARTTEFADIYVGAGEDDEVCLIVSYPADGQAATCVPQSTAADRGLLIVGRKYPGDPIEIVAVVPSDTIAAYLGDVELTIADLLIAQRIQTTSMVFTLETERGTSTIDYDPLGITETDVVRP